MADATYPRLSRCSQCRLHYTQQREKDICPACNEGRPCKDCGQLFWSYQSKLVRCYACARKVRGPRVQYDYPPLVLPMRYGKRGRISADSDNTFWESRGSQEEQERRQHRLKQLQALWRERGWD